MKRKKKETKDNTKSKKTLKGAAKIAGVMAMGLLLNGVMPHIAHTEDVEVIGGFPQLSLEDWLKTFEGASAEDMAEFLSEQRMKAFADSFSIFLKRFKGF